MHIAFHTDKGNIYTIKLDNWAQSRFQAQIERFELFEGNPLKYEIILQLDFNKDIIDFRVRDKYEKYKFCMIPSLLYINMFYTE